MGLKPSEDPSTDPFASDSDSENGDCGTENISIEGECDTSSNESTVSYAGPDFDPIDHPPHTNSIPINAYHLSCDHTLYINTNMYVIVHVFIIIIIE